MVRSLHQFIEKTLYNNFQSFSPKTYKINLVKTLFSRARQLCSPEHLQQEVTSLRQILKNNGYPDWFVDKYSTPPSQRPFSVPKKPFYFEIQYYGRPSELIAKKLCQDIESGYFQLKAIPVYRTRTLTPSIVKDIVPLTHKPLITYLFNCSCGARLREKCTMSLNQKEGAYSQLANKLEHTPKI